jgi:hypothetical protein
VDGRVESRDVVRTHLVNNMCICWLFTHIFTGVLIFKGLTARHLYKSFSVKGFKICNMFIEFYPFRHTHYTVDGQGTSQ